MKDRVEFYSSTPVTVNVRVTMNDTLRFPVLTICNKNVFNMTQINLLEKKMKMGDDPARANWKPTRTNISQLVGFQGMDIKQLWDAITHDPKQLIEEVFNSFIAEFPQIFLGASPVTDGAHPLQLVPILFSFFVSIFQPYTNGPLFIRNGPEYTPHCRFKVLSLRLCTLSFTYCGVFSGVFHIHAMRSCFHHKVADGSPYLLSSICLTRSSFLLVRCLVLVRPQRQLQPSGTMETCLHLYGSLLLVHPR